MSQGDWRAKLAPRLLGTALVLAAPLDTAVHAQETAAEFAPRLEMIDAIMHYAGSGGCETLRNVFGPGLEAIANVFGSSGQSPDEICRGGVLSFGDLSLHRAQDATLIEICTKNKIVDCRKRQEVSTGAPVLTFHASVGVKGATNTAAWSPNNHFLLVYAYPELEPLDKPPRRGSTLIVDVEQRLSRPVIDPADLVGTVAVAWSPDGRFVAVNRQRAIHLFAPDTLEEKGSISAAAACTHNADRMAFTADSSALWVACGGSGGSYRPQAIAIKLGAASLQVEDRLFSVPPAPDLRNFRTTAISRLGDDLILVGEARTGSFDKPEFSARSYSLEKKEPLHPPVSYIPPKGSETYPDIYLTDDLSGILIRRFGWLPDGAGLWSTRSGEHVATLNPKSIMNGLALGAPSRIPSSPLHIAEQTRPESARNTLVVLDGRSGETVQEIGPVAGKWDPWHPRIRGVAGTRNLLVSPDGKMMAHFGRYEIRLYRVDANAAASQPVQGR